MDYSSLKVEYVVVQSSEVYRRLPGVNSFANLLSLRQSSSSKASLSSGFRISGGPSGSGVQGGATNGRISYLVSMSG